MLRLSAVLVSNSLGQHRSNINSIILAKLIEIGLRHLIGCRLAILPTINRDYSCAKRSRKLLLTHSRLSSDFTNQVFQSKHHLSFDTTTSLAYDRINVNIFPGSCAKKALSAYYVPFPTYYSGQGQWKCIAAK